LSQRQRIADIHHHHEADHLGRAVEITEGIAHRRRLRNLATRLKPIYSDNAFLGEVFIRDLRLGTSSVDLILRRDDDDVALQVRRKEGSIRVSAVYT